MGLIWLVVVFCISLRRPELVVCAMGFFTFFTAWRPIDLPIGSFQSSQLLTVAAVAGMLVRGAIRGKQSPGVFRVPLLLLVLVALVSVSALQTAMLDAQSTAELAIIRSGRTTPFIRSTTAVMALVTGMCAFVVTRHLLTDLGLIHLALKSWRMGAVFTILVGAYLWVRHYIPRLPGLPLAAALGVSGYGISERDVASLSVGNDLVVRMASFAMEPRHLTYLLMPVLCFSLVYRLLAKNLIGVERRRLLLAIGVVAVGFALTTSRSTYVLAVIAAGVVLWVTRRHLLASPRALIRTLLLLSLVTVLMLGVLATVSRRNPLEFVRLQLESLQRVELAGSGVSYAIDGYLVAWRMFEDNPISGQGWGSYIYFTKAYGLKFAHQANPNNLYLLMLGETGLIGLLVLLWLFWRGLHTAFAPLPLVVVRAYRPLLSSLGAALLATYACFMLWDAIHYTHVWMLLGLARAVRVVARKEAACVSE